MTNDRYEWTAGDVVITDRDGKPVDVNALDDEDEQK